MKSGKVSIVQKTEDEISESKNEKRIKSEKVRIVDRTEDELSGRENQEENDLEEDTMKDVYKRLEKELKRGSFRFREEAKIVARGAADANLGVVDCFVGGLATPFQSELLADAELYLSKMWGLMGARISVLLDQCNQKLALIHELARQKADLAAKLPEMPLYTHAKEEGIHTNILKKRRENEYRRDNAASLEQIRKLESEIAAEEVKWENLMSSVVEVISGLRMLSKKEQEAANKKFALYLSGVMSKLQSQEVCDVLGRANLAFANSSARLFAALHEKHLSRFLESKGNPGSGRCVWLETGDYASDTAGIWQQEPTCTESEEWKPAELKPAELKLAEMLRNTEEVNHVLSQK